MRLSKATIELCKTVWRNKEDDCHAWRSYYNGYITVMNDSDSEGDYLLVGYVEDIDFLGYPMGKYKELILLDEDDMAAL